MFSDFLLRRHFRNESEHIRKIAIERSSNWEYILTLLLLNGLLAKWESAFDQKKITTSHILEHTDWLKAKVSFLSDVVRRFEPVCRDLFTAWGPPGKPGDGIAIKKAVAKMDVLCRELYEWEVEVASMRFPKDGELVKSLMIGEARFMMTPIKEFTTELSAMLADPKRLGKRHLMLTWKMSPKWNEFTSECDKWIAKMLSR